MALHAVFVTEKTMDFIEQVNGGLRPSDECLKTPTVFVHPDTVADPETNQLMTKAEFDATYKWVRSDDKNSNIVVKK